MKQKIWQHFKNYKYFEKMKTEYPLEVLLDNLNQQNCRRNIEQMALNLITDTVQLIYSTIRCQL